MDYGKDSNRRYHGAQPNAEYGEEATENSTCYFCSLLDPALVPSNDFGYLLTPSDADVLPKSEETVRNLLALGDVMGESNNESAGDSTIPAGFTYWGQFLDHDVTAATDRTPACAIVQDPADVPVMNPSDVLSALTNHRTPAFDLDSVYGTADGPFDTAQPNVRALYDPSDRAKLLIGTTLDNVPPRAVVPHPQLGRERDIPRNVDLGIDPQDPAAALAVLGDERNDENLIISQFHLGWLRFHNALVDAARVTNPRWTDEDVFHTARKEAVRHHEWLLLNQFLVTLCGQEVVNAAVGAPSIFANGVFMPLEFSVAAYRFGHTMVRPNYDFNENFGREGRVLLDPSFDLMFAFTGKGAPTNPNMNSRMPFSWIADWTRFFFDDPSDASAPSPGRPSRFARSVDTLLAEPLSQMANEIRQEDFERTQAACPDTSINQERFNQIMRHLARRNLLRGYVLSMPTAQAFHAHFAADWGLAPVMTPHEIAGDNPATKALIERSGFGECTPLWYYILRESELREGGARLGNLGAHIVARTFIGLLKSVPDSAANTGWSPADSALTGGSVNSIAALLRFAGVMP